MIRLPQRSLSSQSLGRYWQLNQNNQETEYIETQTNDTQKGALMNSTKECTQKKQCKGRQTELGLVTFYDIWLGNGADLYLQPRNPHGVIITTHGQMFVFMISVWISHFSTLTVTQSSPASSTNLPKIWYSSPVESRQCWIEARNGLGLSGDLQVCVHAIRGHHGFGVKSREFCRGGVAKSRGTCGFELE